MQASLFTADSSKVCNGLETMIIFIICLLLLDESFAVKHIKRGMVGMSNHGRHTNGSQFYITLQPAPYMDKQHVAFG